MPVHDQLVTVFRMRDRAQAQSKTEKRAMLATHQEGDEYFAAWTGKWRTDIFEFSVEYLVGI
jgi:hypothetical protein